MPVRMSLKGYSENPPCRPAYYAPIEGQRLDVDRLRVLRAKATQDREELLALQKGTADRDMARFFKDEARYLLRRQRAADFWVKWTTGEGEPPRKWPIELADELDHVHGLATND